MFITNIQIYACCLHYLDVIPNDVESLSGDNQDRLLVPVKTRLCIKSYKAKVELKIMAR